MEKTTVSTQLTHSDQCSPSASSNSTSGTGTIMSATAQGWQRAIQQLEELHNLVDKYEQHLKYNRLRELQAVVASIEALNSQLSSKLHELASVRCPSNAECEEIVCVRKVGQPVLRGGPCFYWGDGRGKGAPKGPGGLPGLKGNNLLPAPNAAAATRPMCAHAPEPAVI